MFQVAGSEGSSSEDSQDSLTGVSRGHKRKLETILEEDRDIEQAEGGELIDVAAELTPPQPATATAAGR